MKITFIILGIIALILVVWYVVKHTSFFAMGGNTGNVKVPIKYYKGVGCAGSWINSGGVMTCQGYITTN